MRKPFENFLKEKKYKIMSDVDGVIVDFVNPWIDWVEKKDPNIKIDKSRYDLGLSGEIIGRYINDFWKSGAMNSLPIYENAKESFNNIAKKHDIYIVSALNNDYFKERKENLKGFNYKILKLIDNNKVEWIIDTLKPDIAIEDDPKNIMRLSGAGIKVYYPKFATYTDGMEAYGNGFDNWKELEEMLIR
jgi:5'(3')-deoxyribonucleotidase